jgi:(4-(4-[2-(gamma-L-glutamylamino)ethyl]phenoxymethyl)furan-2-yl)methanamine synthase
MSWLGLDIGGANLKAADGRGWASSLPFALWREPQLLADALETLLGGAPSASRLAITMTGELCDCFRTKADGVRQILDAVERAAAGRSARVYLVDGRFVTVAAARELPYLAAASNWHALARYVGRFTDCQPGILIDVGSTTTDIVPLVDGRPCPQGSNDTDRLLSGELVYTGVSRTPICAVARTLPWRARQSPVAAELFATTADAYVLLGEFSEQPDANDTADGRPLTVEFARERMARMICADATTFSLADARQAAAFSRDAQIDQLRAAVRQVTSDAGVLCQCIVISGAGDFLARRLVADDFPSSRIISLRDTLGREVSACAPAHAVAALAAEEIGE